jgi:hypothetical protein
MELLLIINYYIKENRVKTIHELIQCLAADRDALVMYGDIYF